MVAARTGVRFLVMDDRPRVTAVDDQRPAMAEVIRRRAATVEAFRMEAERHTAAGRMVAAEGTVDMGGRIALDFFPAQ